MERHKPVLHVHTGSHFEGAAHEHPHLTEQTLQAVSSASGVRLVDECDLSLGFLRHIFPDIVKVLPAVLRAPLSLPSGIISGWSMKY
ncbi:MAG: hypothetical protein ACLUZ4_04715 [Christensenellaceae bacterium]